MIAAVPFLPGPGDVLAGRPELASPVMAAVAALRPEIFSEAYVAAQDPALLALGEAAGLTPLPLPPGPDPTPWPMPPGSAPCVSTLRGLDGTSAQPVLLADPGALGLDADLLRAAAREFLASGTDALVTAVPPRDHPCQFRRPMRIAATGLLGTPGGAGVIGGAAPRLLPRDGGSLVVFDAAANLPATWLLELLDPTSGHAEICPRRDDRDGAPAFASALARPGAVWTLLRDCGPGECNVTLPCVPPGAPWATDPASGRVVRLGGGPIRGRQEFPEVLAPDGTLFILGPGLDPADHAALARATVRPLVPQAPAPFPVRTELDLLRHTLRSHGDGDA